jgi:hypothetical protein
MDEWAAAAPRDSLSLALSRGIILEMVNQMPESSRGSSAAQASLVETGLLPQRGGAGSWPHCQQPAPSVFESGRDALLLFRLQRGRSRAWPCAHSSDSAWSGSDRSPIQARGRSSCKEVATARGTDLHSIECRPPGQAWSQRKSKASADRSRLQSKLGGWDHASEDLQHEPARSKAARRGVFSSGRSAAQERSPLGYPQ